MKLDIGFSSWMRGWMRMKPRYDNAEDEYAYWQGMRARARYEREERETIREASVRQKRSRQEHHDTSDYYHIGSRSIYVGNHANYTCVSQMGETTKVEKDRKKDFYWIDEACDLKEDIYNL